MSVTGKSHIKPSLSFLKAPNTLAGVSRNTWPVQGRGVIRGPRVGDHQSLSIMGPAGRPGIGPAQCPVWSSPDSGPSTPVPEHRWGWGSRLARAVLPGRPSAVLMSRQQRPSCQEIPRVPVPLSQPVAILGYKASTLGKMPGPQARFV